MGLDMVPLNEQGVGFPADVYPVLPGTLRYFYEQYQNKNSKLIAIDTILDEPFVAYLKAAGCIPADYAGQVTLVHMYLHGLEILDKDGTVEQSVPIMKCGNTGDVYTYDPASGTYVPVPEDQKGVPPYPGLHLHLQCELAGENNAYFGVIDPELILNYKQGASPMIVYKKVGEATLYMAVGNVLVGYASDYPTFQAEFPGAVIVELPAEEFAKFKVSTLVIK